jgi:LacI family transcriptional regulator
MGSYHPDYDFLYDLVGEMKLGSRIVFRRIGKDFDGMVDAVIAFGPMSKEEETKLSKIAPVILYIDHNTHSYAYDTIIVDYGNGMNDVFNYLGHCKKIGYIGGIGTDGNRTIGQQRIDNFKQVLQSHGKLDESAFLVADISRDSGWQLAEKAIKENRLCNGYLIGQEAVASGVIGALKQYGKFDEVSLVVYRDIPYLKESAYPKVLNLFSQTVWKSAIHMIMEKISGERIESLVVYAPPRLES